MSTLKAALWYRRNGFSVIPVKRNKRPYLLSWAPYQKKIPTEGEVKEWWGEWPDAQVAIVCGEVSNIMVLDADSPEAEKALSEFLPDTIVIPTVQTAKGRHYYFRYDKAVKPLTHQSCPLPDTDLKTDGGYVLAPPSMNLNGNYKFLEGLKIDKTPIPYIPSFLKEMLVNTACSEEATKKQQKSNIAPQKATKAASNKSSRSNKSNIDMMSNGRRDDDLFGLAWHLVKSGMPSERIWEYMQFYADNSNPQFSKKDAEEKLQSALRRHRVRNATGVDGIIEWIEGNEGSFTISNYYAEAGVKEPEDKKKVRAVFSRISKEGLIERVGRWSGTYRRVETDIERLDWLNAPDETVGIRLPFGLNEIIEVHPGNVIIVAGNPDAGKTGVLLNVIRENMDAFDITYFSSEMGSNELKKRLSKFDDMRLTDWKFNAFGYKPEYSDFIKGGKGNIYIIDYLELLTDFFLVKEKINSIFRKLNGAIGIIALQQKPGCDLPVGGSGALEKARLAISIKFQEVEILKAKNKLIEKSVIGWKKDFKLIKGANIMETSEWR